MYLFIQKLDFIFILCYKDGEGWQPIGDEDNAFSVNASTSYAALYPPKVHEKEQSKDIMITTNPNVFFAV